jgi:hypothetical protein
VILDRRCKDRTILLRRCGTEAESREPGCLVGFAAGRQGNLSARIRTLCRRTSDATDVLRIGDATLDLSVRDAVLPDGTQVSLSAREFELLRVLAARPAAVHPRAVLRGRVFDEAAAASIVDTYVAAIPPVSAGRGSRCR